MFQVGGKLVLRRLLSKRWQPEETALLEQNYSHLGPSWTIIASRMKGRSSRECKTHFFETNLEDAFRKSLRVPLESLENHRKGNALPFKEGENSRTYFERFMATYPEGRPLEQVQRECAEKRANFDKSPDAIPIIRSKLFSWPHPLDYLNKEDKATFNALIEGLEPCPTPLSETSMEEVSNEETSSDTFSVKPLKKDIASSYKYSQWIEYISEDMSQFPRGSLHPVSRLEEDIPREKYAYKFNQVRHIWSDLEDQVLREAFETFPYNWQQISFSLQRRTPEECRLRMTELYASYNVL